MHEKDVYKCVFYLILVSALAQRRNKGMSPVKLSIKRAPQSLL